MQIIHLADFCSVATQLMGTGGVALLAVNCELIVPVMASCSRPVGEIESCCLWLRTSDEER